MKTLKYLALSLITLSMTSVAVADGKSMGNTKQPQGQRDTTVPTKMQHQNMGQVPSVNQSTVRRAQEKLSDEGYDLRVDGMMGPETISALKRYQKANNLNTTGQLDQETVDSLGIDVEERAPASVPQTDETY